MKELIIYVGGRLSNYSIMYPKILFKLGSPLQWDPNLKEVGSVWGQVEVVHEALHMSVLLRFYGLSV